MIDPQFQTDETDGPQRCDFCGRRKDESQMLNGPGARICTSCIQDAKGLVDTSSQDPRPAPRDYEAAYVVLKRLPDPLRDFNEQFHAQGSELHVMAEHVYWFRAEMEQDMVSAMRGAKKLALTQGLKTRYRDH